MRREVQLSLRMASRRITRLNNVLKRPRLHATQPAKRMRGADAGVQLYMLHGPPQRRTSCIGISQQWRVPHRWQFGPPSTSALISKGGYRGAQPQS